MLTSPRKIPHSINELFLHHQGIVLIYPMNYSYSIKESF